MPEKSNRRFILVVIAVVIIAILAIIFFHHRNNITPTGSVQNINYAGLPTVGKADAPNQILAIEDLKCHGCMIYNNTVYPQLKKELIDTGKASYHVLLVSFLPGSEPAANAALCLYEQDPAYFFQFVHDSYANQPPETEDWATPARLMQIARASTPNANFNKLSQCMLSNKYAGQLKKNIEYGGKLLGGVLSTPTLFVNGRKVNLPTMSGIKPLLK